MTAFLLPNQITPTVDVAGFFHYESGLHPVYRNPSHHLILVESGCVCGSSPRSERGAAEGVFEAKAGALVCFRPTDRNEYRIPIPTLFYQAHISFAPPPRHRCTPFFPGVGPLPSIVQLGRAFDEMREQFEVFCLSTPCGDAVNRLRVQAAVFNMLRIIAGIMKPTRHPVIALDEWERARWWLASTEGLALKTHELAREMGLSVRHFSRVFRQRFGCTPKEYQMQARLSEIRHRLCGGNTPIKAIAADLGFENARSLARMTRRVLGVSPTDLRRSLPSSVVLPKSPAKRPYPVNRHLVPPGTPSNWQNHFRWG